MKLFSRSKKYIHKLCARGLHVLNILMEQYLICEDSLFNSEIKAKMTMYSFSGKPVIYSVKSKKQVISSKISLWNTIWETDKKVPNGDRIISQ